MFLGHEYFYWHFIKDFSKITTPLCRVFEKDMVFNFYEAFLKAFNELKKQLVAVLIIITPDWSLPFKMKCNASDHVIREKLGQVKRIRCSTLYIMRVGHLIMHR